MATTINIGDASYPEPRIAPGDMKTCLIARARDLIDSLANESGYIPTTDKRYLELKSIKRIFQVNGINVGFEV